MGIHIPRPNPPPREIIPYIETRLIEHNNRRNTFLSDRSGDYFEWKAIKEDLEQFISYLSSLNPANSVNLVNPVQNSSSDQRRAAELNPDQNRTALQTNDPARTKNEPETDQMRTETEPKVENAAQAPAIASAPNSKNPKTPEPTEPARETREQYLDRLNKEIPNMSPQQLQELASKTILPKPEESNIEQYGSMYFRIYGPPKRVRIDNLHAEVQRWMFQMLEDLSLEKVQRQLMLPPPFGHYIIVSKSALRRFKLRHQAHEAKRNQLSLRKQISAILSQPDLPDTDFARVTDQLLKLRVVESGLKPDPDLKETKILVDLLEKIRAGKLAERKLALAEAKK
jgi:hypothetical protein